MAFTLDALLRLALPQPHHRIQAFLFLFLTKMSKRAAGRRICVHNHMPFQPSIEQYQEHLLAGFYLLLDTPYLLHPRCKVTLQPCHQIISKRSDKRTERMIGITPECEAMGM